MKIIITGSLGHISKPLTQQLIAGGHEVTVISSKDDRREEIEALGATAAIGSLEDVEFLTQAFTGADAVYSMVPPNHYFDKNLDLIPYYERLGTNYYEAVKSAGVKRLVNLSTIGGNLSEGNGILKGAHRVELILNKLSDEVAITHMRPTSFNYNLYGYIDSIKNKGVITANYGGEDIMPWVSPLDIADAVAEELVTPNPVNKVRYVCSEELSCNETARILGEAIGKPDLQWKTITDQEELDHLVAVGMNPKIAEGLVEMYGALHTGVLAADYFANRPAVMGKVKIKDFAEEFAAVYNQK
jgi:uncharacterized protein YbjT (DUF2867 family)